MNTPTETAMLSAILFLVAMVVVVKVLKVLVREVGQATDEATDARIAAEPKKPVKSRYQW